MLFYLFIFLTCIFWVMLLREVSVTRVAICCNFFLYFFFFFYNINSNFVSFVRWTLPRGMWMGVCGGEIKPMVSWVNEGRFTQNNEGQTHFFILDVYLKDSINAVSELKALSADIHIHPATTWGLALSPASLLAFTSLSFCSLMPYCNAFPCMTPQFGQDNYILYLFSHLSWTFCYLTGYVSGWLADNW